MSPGDIIHALIAPLRAQVEALVLKGVANLITETTKARLVQVTLRADDTPEVQHWEPYGFTSRPAAGAEVLVCNVEGSPDNRVALLIFDRRHRPTDSDPLEVGLFDSGVGAAKQRIRLRPGVGIEIEAPNGVDVDGDVETSGDIDTPGTITGGVVTAGNGATATYANSVVVLDGIVVGGT
jgi:phage gp45-like